MKGRLASLAVAILLLVVKPAEPARALKLASARRSEVRATHILNPQITPFLASSPDTACLARRLRPFESSFLGMSRHLSYFSQAKKRKLH